MKSTSFEGTKGLFPTSTETGEYAVPLGAVYVPFSVTDNARTEISQPPESESAKAEARIAS